MGIPTLTLGEDEREEDASSDSAEPDGPVGERVRGEVLRSSEEANKEHLGTDVRVDGDRDEQTRQSDTICNLLDHDTGRSQSWVGEVLSAVVVDDDADGEVGGSDDRLASVQGLVVVLRSSHLSNDVEELRISAGGGRIKRKELTAGVPEYEKTTVETAAIPPRKVPALLNAEMFLSQGPT
jgi:hypothetical protein